MKGSLPVVDLSSGQVVDQILEACATVGFFYLVNHGVSEDLVERTFAASRQFFSLPLEEKLLIEAGSNGRGYTRYLDETLDLEKQTMGDTKEGFYLGRTVLPGDKSTPLDGENKFPSEHLLPGWKQTMEEYNQEVWRVSKSLLPHLEAALQCPEKFFVDRFSCPLVFLRLLHYSEEQSREEEGIFGAGAHTDFGMLTLLATDDVPGLQIYTSYSVVELPDGKIGFEKADEPRWIDVPPMKNAFIVNLGDMFELWTNGKFKSTLHRVVNHAGKERYSIPFFFEPNFDCYVEPMKQFCPPGQSSPYKPTTSGQHLLQCYARTSKCYTESLTEEERRTILDKQY